MTDSLFDNSEDQLYNVEKILDKKKSRWKSFI
jgi:hypothetical protein